MTSTAIEFTNQEGNALSAKIDRPDGEPTQYAVFAHCFTCTKNINAVRRISRALTERGIGVLSFDFTGLGRSEGDFSSAGFSSQAGDLVAAARYLETEVGSGPTMLIGHSLGGTASLYAARELPGVKGVATIGSPADPGHVTKLFDGDVAELETRGEADVNIGGRSFCIRKGFVDDLRNHPPDQWLPELRKNLLIFHSPLDTTVGIDNAERIFKAVKHPKSFVSLDQADHLLSKADDAAFVARMVGSWAATFADADDKGTPANAPITAAEGAAAEGSSASAGETPPASTPALDADYTLAASIGTEKWTVQMTNGRHYMVGDEPESAHGQDRGGNPFDYLLSALGSCTVMTVKMYADRKEWPLRGVTAQLRHKKVKPDEIGADPEVTKAAGGRADHIEILLRIDGDLSDEQREKLVEIAHKCPVHRTLISPTQVDITPA
jgi:putative redox protein